MNICMTQASGLRLAYGATSIWLNTRRPASNLQLFADTSDETNSSSIRNLKMDWATNWQRYPRKELFFLNIMDVY